MTNEQLTREESARIYSHEFAIVLQNFCEKRGHTFLPDFYKTDTELAPCIGISVASGQTAFEVAIDLSLSVEEDEIRADLAIWTRGSTTIQNENGITICFAGYSA